MGRWRWGLYLVGAVLTLALALGFLQNLLSLYTQILTLSGATVANLLLGLLLLVVLGFLLTLARIFWLVGRPTRPQPHARQTTVRAQLEAIAQQLAQIEDQVTRQALEAQHRELAAQQARQPLRLVIMGTASTGKTALVNTLLGRMVGEVAATLGTTTTAQVYEFRLKGVPRRIELMDTPGLQEGTAAGLSREMQAREWPRSGFGDFRGGQRPAPVRIGCTPALAGIGETGGIGLE
jgi:GTP-binding conserved hypothetical protein